MYRQTSEGINAVEEFFIDSDLYDGLKEKDETENEAYWKKIISKKFPKLMRDMSSQIQEASYSK